MPAKKDTPKDAAKKVAVKKTAAKKTTAKKAAAKKSAAPKGKKTGGSETKVPSEEIAKAAYLNYRRRMDLGLPGDHHSDWLEAERSFMA